MPSKSADFAYTFPPFPSPPPGTKIIPFNRYKPRGILRNTPLGQHEQDNLGIPTIPLPNRHDTDKPKTEAGRARHIAQQQATAAAKKTSRENPSAPAPPPTGPTWWEDWSVNEANRVARSFAPHHTLTDRLVLAAADFKTGRNWPQATRSSGAVFIWEKFRLYLGLPDSSGSDTTSKSTNKGKAKGPGRGKITFPDLDMDSGDDSMDDEDNDDDADLDLAVAADCGAAALEAQNNDEAKMNIDANPNVYQKDVQSELAAKREQQRIARNAASLDLFMSDPDTSVKVFLSSYARNKGILWPESNLTNLPRLVAFFLEFLIRSRVFPTTHNPMLKRALNTTISAQTELPFTSSAAKNLPDAFGRACARHWGRQSEGSRLFAQPLIKDDSKTEKSGTNNEKIEAVDPTGMWGPTSTINGTWVVNDASNGESSWNSSGTGRDTGGGWGSEDAGWDVDCTMDSNGGWGTTFTKKANDDGWGTVDDSNNRGWGADTGEDKGEAGGWGSTVSSDTAGKKGWETPLSSLLPKLEPPPTLQSLLGPTNLPLTHAPGIVECSMRAIKKIYLQPEVASHGDTVIEYDDSTPAHAVEHALQRNFVRVVLEPWIGWDEGTLPHLSHPRILDDYGTLPMKAGIHEPEVDDITLLVQPRAAEALTVGLGLAGTWVQLARIVNAKVPNETGDMHGMREPGPFWYADEVTMVIPSFWTVKSALENPYS